ncbi:MAG: hypothetical protein KME32_32500 [Mojavia pulchra JT2-VF2]|jgi:hypothetical protein|uniref:Uncharacterized protein n=1 Tax=Mojavia pulchra JT2-VF2 TaxID=287848 RepID=A0A951Q6U8_9NOST|nr:hypothetical protein [Mojavia pulchra JT2-VF2]
MAQLWQINGKSNFGSILAIQWQQNGKSMEFQNVISQLIITIENWDKNWLNFGTAMAWLWHTNGN